ncbi:hypothetical protein GCM10010341_75880 [Streptomyces noursei]|nr:hypothetical protein GCM10010341_75880 [Streptomyces noursei]
MALAAVLRDRPTTWRLTWGVIGVAGVGLVVLSPAARLDAVGVLAGLGGTAAMAGGVVLTKHWGRPAGVGPLTLAGWQLTAGGLLLLPLALAIEGVPQRIDAGAAGGYLWLASTGGLIAYALWFRGIGKLPVGASAPLVLLSPLVATIVGVVLGESLSLLQTLVSSSPWPLCSPRSSNPRTCPDPPRTVRPQKNTFEKTRFKEKRFDEDSHDDRRARRHRNGRKSGDHRGQCTRTPGACPVPEACE